MKNKNVILGIIIVLFVILSGIGIGCLFYKIDNQEILVDIKHKKLHEEDYMESCVSVKINGKDVSEEIWIKGYKQCEYEIYNKLVLLTVYDDASGYSDLYIYNNKSEKLFDMSEIPSDLLTLRWEFDKVNSKVIFYSQLTEETGGTSNRVEKITGKDLYYLSCNELKYYKDKIVAVEIHEITLKDNNISSIKLVNQTYLENYVDVLSNFNHYDWLLKECNRNNESN